jgi:diguanylate cyclase (GGDEF)-like protein/PAS domain S-box-containing protein
MKRFKLKQLHFHLKNNDSFLRFHRPDKFGDNLSDIRHTVKYVNENRTPLHGFEEGRIFNGYRFVYPLFYGEKYLGSVETSVSMETIMHKFQDEVDSEVSFIIKKETVDNKVFQDERGNYISTPFSKNYLYERAIHNSIDSENLESCLLDKIKSGENLDAKLNAGKTFTVDHYFQNSCNIITFLPIKNGITGDVVAYIIVSKRHFKLEATKMQYIAVLIVLIVITGVILMFQYRIQKSRDEVFHQKEILEEVQGIGHLGYWEINFLTGETLWSDEMFNILGVTKGFIANPDFNTLLHFIHDEDRVRINGLFISSIKEKKGFKVYHRIVRESGEVRYIEHECNNITDENGEVIHSIGTLHDITNLKLYEMELERAKDQYEALVNNIPDVVFRAQVDEDCTMVYLNSSIEVLTKYRASDFLWNRVRSYYSIIHDDDKAYVKREIEEAMKNSGEYRVEYRILNRDGEIVWVSERGEISKVDSNDVVSGIINNITPQKMAYEKLKRFIDSQESIVVLSDGTKLLFANHKFFGFIGSRDLDEFLSAYNCICDHFKPDRGFFSLDMVPENENWIETLLKMPQKDRLVAIDSFKGVEHIFSVSINAFEDGNYIITFNDISDTILEKIKLQNNIVRDTLTGAFNRFFFDTSYKTLIREFRDSERETGVVIFDIDHFKVINDTYGHNVGDVVLKELVARTKARIRKDEDILIRWGGEEFLLILPVNNIDGLYKLAESIRMIIGDQEFNEVGRVTCSFGITIYRSGEDIIETIERADSALYKAKKSGRDRVVIS